MPNMLADISDFYMHFIQTPKTLFVSKQLHLIWVHITYVYIMAQGLRKGWKDRVLYIFCHNLSLNKILPVLALHQHDAKIEPNNMVS